jgi:hypothetical protein
MIWTIYRDFIAVQSLGANSVQVLLHTINVAQVTLLRSVFAAD